MSRLPGDRAVNHGGVGWVDVIVPAPLEIKRTEKGVSVRVKFEPHETGGAKLPRRLMRRKG
jgi:hypothetical protein